MSSYQTDHFHCTYAAVVVAEAVAEDTVGYIHAVDDSSAVVEDNVVDTEDVAVAGLVAEHVEPAECEADLDANYINKGYMANIPGGFI